jgi:hypothetical protein
MTLRTTSRLLTNVFALLVMLGALSMVWGMLDLDYLQHIFVGVRWDGSFSELWNGPFLYWGFRVVLFGLCMMLLSGVFWIVSVQLEGGDDVYWWALEQEARKKSSSELTLPVMRAALDIESDRDGWRPETMMRYLLELEKGKLAPDDAVMVGRLVADVQANLAQLDSAIRGGRKATDATFVLGGKEYTGTELMELLGQIKGLVREVRGYEGADPSGTPAPMSRR